MPNIKPFLPFMLCFACIFSCATTGTSSAASGRGKGALFVNLTDKSKFVLLPAEGIERSIDMAQSLSAEFNKQIYFLNAWVKADENAIEMIIFNEMGASMGEISYRNDAVQFSSSVIPKSAMKYIKPEYVIADFQLCFYDPILIENSLKKCGLVLETDNGDRRILNGDELIIEIKKTVNSVKLVNHLKGYAYTLEGDFS